MYQNADEAFFYHCSIHMEINKVDCHCSTFSLGGISIVNQVKQFIKLSFQIHFIVNQTKARNGVVPHSCTFQVGRHPLVHPQWNNHPQSWSYTRAAYSSVHPVSWSKMGPCPLHVENHMGISMPLSPHWKPVPTIKQSYVYELICIIQQWCVILCFLLHVFSIIRHSGALWK